MTEVGQSPDDKQKQPGANSPPAAYSSEAGVTVQATSEPVPDRNTINVTNSSEKGEVKAQTPPTPTKVSGSLGVPVRFTYESKTENLISKTDKPTHSLNLNLNLNLNLKESGI